ncbi:Winged helix-turn-helix DNA-binding domain [Plasmopara halstedii]|uniref:Winged helix-turn-helix DNA-binding domain n=1 Tax=Plasmopara halstedii TaxID=4781 RepID=A0A0P1B8Z2_PLAHL|nr:Winged helix-turn-helix DNA-binding domain [Plasmopara halstedii]CEG50456.1 Winged helix-turn-helix DNA-binding domain [Plasmopara halstedii]|eukprot:XP_024586825.1 Winged helix-turn-helix DNA-binding domain [Plasmopara halstedii]
MSPLPVCMSPSISFTVPNPLHRHPCQQQSAPDLVFPSTTPKKALYHLASPTMSHSGTRLPPAVSPSKRSRKSRVVFDFSTEEMAKYFHMSQREAAQQLGVATVTIKRNCRRLGIVWPYRLMKSKKHAINWSAISREDAQRIRHMRALEHAKAGRTKLMHSRRRLSDASNKEEVMTAPSYSKVGNVELTEAGRAFARLPLDCMATLE